MPRPTIFLTGEPKADALLSKDPLALLLGMVLDQQIPMERAFWGPWELARRMGGTLNAAAIADMDPEKFTELFREKPALHRFPGSMAGRVQAVCRIIADEYGGKAANLWRNPASGKELIARLTALPGFGAQKARIFAALLGKQLGVQPEGWIAATKPYGDPGTHHSIADITDADTLAQVRAHKQAMKAKARAKG